MPPQSNAESLSSLSPLSLKQGDTLTFAASEPTTLPAALRRAATQSPIQDILHLNANGLQKQQTYAELLDEAQCVLAGLRSQGLNPQDKVLFQLDQSTDFLVVFWACMLGGLIPVPLSIAPTYQHPNGALTKLQNAWQMLGRPVIVAGEALVEPLEHMVWTEQPAEPRVVCVEALRAHPPDTAWHDSQADDLALLLLTSGSTGMPKAVMLTHRNMLARSAGTARNNQFTRDDVSLNWFPLDHVGGIVMFHVRDVFLACRQIHAPIQTVLEDPLRWLEWIERYHVTITWAPNFAYSLINERHEEIAQRGFDLSSLRFILNAGEAIVAKSVRRFLALLEAYGLPKTAMHPAWGMSETSSAFTYSDRFTQETTADEDPFVSVGVPIPGGSVRIVQADDQCVPEGVTGRLQVAGLSVTGGYYQNPAVNQESFTADGWFKTGDLGVMRDGQLTITGREKDVIIINGINYYSHEIEAVVEEVAGVEPSFTAATAVRAVGSDTDKLAVFFHSDSIDDSAMDALLKTVRNAIVTKIGLNPNYLLPVPKEDIPKTAIGKIQRSHLRQRLEAGEFSHVFKQIAQYRVQSNREDTAPPQTEWERQVVDIWQTVLSLPQIGIHDNFFELGGDSLLATQIISRLRAAFHVNATLRHLFEGPTIAQLSATIEQLQITEMDAEEMDALLLELEGLSEEETALLLVDAP
jgi:acyl-CoA synthetase (AMP-forming)/AMP-acid ligase II/acyl carrier protein